MRCRTMSDGSLRIEVEIEPKDAQAAFLLFGRPGAPMALAALKEGYAAASDEPEEREPEKPKGGVLSQWAATRCAEQSFQEWMAREFAGKWKDGWNAPAERCAYVIRAICQIRSRAELDHNEYSANIFREQIMTPWQKHCIATGIA